jgi:hypothetical protein
MAKQQRVVPEQSQQAPAFDVCDAAMDQQPANGSNAFSVETAGLGPEAGDAALERDMVHDLYDQMWEARAFKRVGAWARDAAHLDSWLANRSLAQVFADPSAVALQDWVLDRYLPPGVTHQLQLERVLEFSLCDLGGVGVGNVAAVSVRRVGRALILDWEGESTVGAALDVDAGGDAAAVDLSSGMTVGLGTQASVGVAVDALPKLLAGAITPAIFEALVPSAQLWEVLKQGQLAGVQVTYTAGNETRASLEAGDRDEWVPFREALGSAGVFDQLDVLVGLGMATEFAVQAGVDAARGSYATFRAAIGVDAERAVELDPALLELAQRAGLDLGPVTSAFELAVSAMNSDAHAAGASLAFTVFPDAPEGARLQMQAQVQGADVTRTRTVVGLDAVVSELLAIAIPGDSVQHGVVEQELRIPAPEHVVQRALAELGLNDPGAHQVDDDKSRLSAYRDFELVSTLRCWAKEPRQGGAGDMSELVEQGIQALQGDASSCDAELDAVRLVGSVVHGASMRRGDADSGLDVDGTHSVHLDRALDLDPLTFLLQARAR